jgi:hypothetical protein
MWNCPKCGENIEDWLDSCWKCSGEAQAPTDAFWRYPVVSLVSLALVQVGGCFWHPRYYYPHFSPSHYGLGAALLGVIGSSVGIWAFLSCPLRRWYAKILTLVLMITALDAGIDKFCSYMINLLGYGGYGYDGGWLWPIGLMFYAAIAVIGLIGVGIGRGAIRARRKRVEQLLVDS